MSALAIIGTAGRAGDASLLTPNHWRMMCIIAQTVCVTTRATRLVSGGSAWADHVAVQLYLDGVVPDLTLHLPARFPVDTEHDVPAFEHTQAGDRLNDLHDAFYEVTDVDPFDQLDQAIRRGAKVTVNPGGFKARNVDIARSADAILAFTFSGGDQPNDGGTAHTWSVFKEESERRNQAHLDSGEQYESPCGCTSYLIDYLNAYHYDLKGRRLYRHQIEPKWELDPPPAESFDTEPAEPAGLPPRERTQEEIDHGFYLL